MKTKTPAKKKTIAGRTAKAVGSGPLVRRVSVRLSEKDWCDLVNFVQGDLDNMPEDDEIKEQMSRILDTIRKARA
jgi:hypothetical protein